MKEHIRFAICILYILLPALALGIHSQTDRLTLDPQSSLMHAAIEQDPPANPPVWLANDYDRDDWRDNGRDGYRDYDRDRWQGRRDGDRDRFPDGIERTDVTDAQGILRTIVIAVEAAVNEGGLDNLVDELVEADRDRIGNYPNQRFYDLNDVVNRFHRVWERKYNRPLDVRNFSRPIFRDFAYITQGEITEPRELRDWPPDPTRYIRIPKTHPRRGDRDATNLHRGRDVALLILEPREGLPRLTVSMINERSDHWRIDIADNISGSELKRNLIWHLTTMLDRRDQWPDDPDRAYQMVAHHVLMAVYGVPPR